MGIKVLVADDEKNISDSIAYALKRENYEVYTAYDGEEALEIIEIQNPQILILDVMMPKYNGYDICKKVAYNMAFGIIMLTAKSELIDKVLGLELGADDYITKPFDMQELIARVRSLSRRIGKSKITGDMLKEEDCFSYDTFKIKFKDRIVYLDGEALYFKPREFDLLAFLISNKRVTFTREVILDRVWGQEYLGGTRTIDIHIQRIRKKLGKYGNLIRTVPKIGYKAVGNMDEN